MTHVLYPETLPLSCVTSAIEILRAGQAVARKDELGLHLWNVQGFAQRHLLGVPLSTELPFGSARMSDVERATLIELGERLEAWEPRFANTPAADDPQAGIDPATIMAIVAAVVQVIRLLRERKQAA